METKWNDSENEALRGLSMLAQLIYLKVFRRHMDYSTGIAGQRYRIDYQAICDAVGFVPDPGSKAPRWLPTKAQVRAAIHELERARPLLGSLIALLVEAGSGPHWGYVKKLPLASVDQSARKRNDAGTTHEQHKRNNARSNAQKERKTEEYQDCAETEQRTETCGQNFCCSAMNDTPPESGIREEEDNPPNPPSRPVGGQPSAPGFVLPSSISPEIWEEFEQHRKAIRKPLNAQSRTKNANVLAQLTHEQQQASVDNTIANRYTGLFPPKVNGYAIDRSTSGARFRAAAEASLAEHWDDPDPAGFRRA